MKTAINYSLISVLLLLMASNAKAMDEEDFDPGNTSVTKLLICVQDNKNPEGTMLFVSVPQPVEDGPVGAGIEIITTTSRKAVKDSNGDFLSYAVDQEGNIAPRVILNRPLHVIRNKSWSLITVDITKVQRGRVNQYSSIVENDGQRFFISSGNFRFFIPSFAPLPTELAPFDSRGVPVPSFSVSEMSFLDSVSTFGSIFSVLKMWGEDINAVGRPIDRQRWNQRGNIKVFPHMTPTQFQELYPQLDYVKYIGNAFYHYRQGDPNGEHVLCFFPVSLGSSEYTSKFFGVPAHESGHYTVNTVRPDLRQSLLSEAKAFDETFGDVSVFFTLLTFPELRRKVLVETGGNLRRSSFLSMIGKGIVDRDASQSSDISTFPSCEEHEYSTRLTRSIYGTLADVFQIRRQKRSVNLNNNLLGQTARVLRRLFLKATLTTDSFNFSIFGRKMMTQGNHQFNNFLYENFAKHGIDISNPLSLRCIPVPQQRRSSFRPNQGMCATRQVIQDQKLSEEAINISAIETAFLREHMYRENNFFWNPEEFNS